MPRKAGSRNRDKVEFREKMRRHGCDPEEFLALVVNNKVSCAICEGVSGRNECEICSGVGYEHVKISDRVKAGVRLLDSLQPKLASQTIRLEKRRVVVARLNHMSAPEQVKIEEIISDDVNAR